jgi:hypothetical protein
MVADAQELPQRLQLTTLALFALACAFTAVVLGTFTSVGSWIYLAAPTAAAIAEGLREIRRSGPIVALAFAGSAFGLAVIFMVLGSLVEFFLTFHLSFD